MNTACSTDGTEDHLCVSGQLHTFLLLLHFLELLCREEDIWIS